MVFPSAAKRLLLPRWASLSHAWPSLTASLCAQAASPVPETLSEYVQETALSHDEGLTPRAVVEQLDRFIIGQGDAKRAVAVALRNRWRRHKIPAPFSQEIVPKNILMIGPTGCGKTEIARRLAKLANSPFVKVEATKFTEVGFHGRDVDQIIRDLVDNALQLIKSTLKEKLAKEIEKAVEDKIIEKLVGYNPTPEGSRDRESFRWDCPCACGELDLFLGCCT